MSGSSNPTPLAFLGASSIFLRSTSASRFRDSAVSWVRRRAEESTYFLSCLGQNGFGFWECTSLRLYHDKTGSTELENKMQKYPPPFSVACADFTSAFKSFLLPKRAKLQVSLESNASIYGRFRLSYRVS